MKCCAAAARLIELGRHEQAEKICRGACAIAYGENCHLLLMQAMVAQGARHSAIANYTLMNTMLMNQLGVSPSQEMTGFYRELTKAEMGVEMDLQVVRQGLLEECGRGAFFCEYVTFQDIYRLKVRGAGRNGQAVQLAMLTALDSGGRLEAERCAVALNELHNAMHLCLRAGDTFTRFSTSQYLMLLPTASYEDGQKVLCPAPKFNTKKS